MVAMACVLMASDMRFPSAEEQFTYDVTIEEPPALISFTMEPEHVQPEPEPEPQPEPEVKPPPVLVEYKVVEFTPPPPEPIVAKVEPPVAVNPIAKPKVVKKVKPKKKAKPVVKPPAPPEPPKVYETFEIDNPPEYPGGYGALRSFIKNNVKYSAICRENGIEGKVFVRFVIDTAGQVTDVKLARGTKCQIDEEAIEVVKKLPKWEPGMKQNKAVSVQMIVPIDFRLE